MVTCPTIAYLNYLENLTPGIDAITAKILENTHSITAERNVSTEDSCFICNRAASYYFSTFSYNFAIPHVMYADKKLWCCGYCAVSTAHEIYTVIENETTVHIKNSLASLKI